MDYNAFLEEQIKLQESEVKNSRTVMYLITAIATLFFLYSIISMCIFDHQSGLDIIKLGFSVVTNFLPFIKRAEIIKRLEKISGLKAIRGQYLSLVNLPVEEKNFVSAQLQSLMSQTINKI